MISSVYLPWIFYLHVTAIYHCNCKSFSIYSHCPEGMPAATMRLMYASEEMMLKVMGKVGQDLYRCGLRLRLPARFNMCVSRKILELRAFLAQNSRRHAREAHVKARRKTLYGRSLTLHHHQLLKWPRHVNHCTVCLSCYCLTNGFTLLFLY